jgi:hypothetical protein
MRMHADVAIDREALIDAYLAFVIDARASRTIHHREQSPARTFRASRE